MLVRPDLSALAHRVGPGVLTRYAPSPTGYLHLGHVVNAVYVWGVAGALGGRVLLRIEDHDRIRCRAEYEAALLEDLEWLGFTDHGPAEAGHYVPPHPGRAGHYVPPRPGEAGHYVRQSDQPAVYEEALAGLRQQHHVYACDCSRKEIGGERYGGACRARTLDDRSHRGVRVEIGLGVERFEDALLGAQEQEPADQCGDLLLRDRDGHWTYQFAVAVDDQRQGVGLVIRGADLLTSTGRQIRLARMLGRQQPAVFLHHPLVLNASGERAGEKLSKSAGDTSVRDLRAAGLSPAEVIGRAAAAAGLIDSRQPIPASEVSELFRSRTV